MFRNIAIDYESNQRGTSTINYPGIIGRRRHRRRRIPYEIEPQAREIFTNKLDGEIGGGDDGRVGWRGWMAEKRARRVVGTKCC